MHFPLHCRDARHAWSFKRHVDDFLPNPVKLAPIRRRKAARRGIDEVFHDRM